MTKTTQKGVKFDWGDKQEAAFQLLKQKLCSAPILALPEGSEDFIAYCDASKKGFGAMCCCKEEMVISYASHVEKALSVRGPSCTGFMFIRVYNNILDQMDLNMSMSLEGTRTTKGSGLSDDYWLGSSKQILYAQTEARKLENIKKEDVGELVQETTERIIQIKQRIQTARDRQKSYADLKRKPMEFQVGDKVMLKVLPWKGVVRFGKRWKLNPRYAGPFKVLKKVGTVSYKLDLPQVSKVHNTFHVSNLKKCYSDDPLVVPLEGLQVDDKLNFVEEPVEIMDR
ncbi:putative reverse transcriptase domain-containing protein [Tanacetum coccineum]|uniref:Reverse transcriptase domain-containing protein n=1 Tax=Tanacetum coccineum TaxID=301880 RepID=A0ABQ5F507_9ASTR